MIQSKQGFLGGSPSSLALYRLMHFIVLAFFITRFMPRDWRGLQWPVFRPLIKCGQQSLEVFCFDVFLAVSAHVALVEVSNDIWMQILVSTVGIALMTVLAYYGSWSKDADKSHAKAIGRSGGGNDKNLYAKLSLPNGRNWAVMPVPGSRSANSVVSESDADCAMTVPLARARSAFEGHAQRNCPVSRVLSGVDIHLRAKLL